MKSIRLALVSLLVVFLSSCASTSVGVNREYVAVKAEDVAYIISGIQEAVHLASGSLIAVGIELESAKLTLGIGNVIKSGADVGLEVLTASVSNELNATQGLEIHLSPIPFSTNDDNLGYLNPVTNTTSNIPNDALARDGYVIVKSEDDIESDAGRLAFAIAAPLGGLIGTGAKPPFKVDKATMTLGIDVSRTKTAGIAGFELGSAKIGASTSKNTTSSNKIVLTFKPSS